MSEDNTPARDERDGLGELRARSRGRKRRNAKGATRGRSTRNTRRRPSVSSSTEHDTEAAAPQSSQADQVEFAFNAPMGAEDGASATDAVPVMPIFETTVPRKGATDGDAAPRTEGAPLRRTPANHPRRAALVAFDSDDESDRANGTVDPGADAACVSRVTFAPDQVSPQPPLHLPVSGVISSTDVARDAQTADPLGPPLLPPPRATEHTATPSPVSPGGGQVIHLTEFERAVAEREARIAREAEDKARRIRERREQDDRLAAETARNRPDPIVVLACEVRRIVAIEADATSTNVTHPGYLGDVVAAIEASVLAGDAARGRVTWGAVMDLPLAACENLRSAIHSFAQDAAPCHISFVAPSVLRARIINSVRGLRWDHQAPLTPFFRLLASPALVNSPHGTRLLQNKGAFVSDLEYAWAGLVASPRRPFFGHAQSRARSGGHWQHERTMAPWSAACAPASYLAYMSAMIRHAKMWDPVCIEALVCAVCHACDGVRKRGKCTLKLDAHDAEQHNAAAVALGEIAAEEEREIRALTQFEQRIRSMLREPMLVVDECENNMQSHSVARELRTLVERCRTRDVFSSGISNVAEWTTAYRRCMPILTKHVRALRVFYAIKSVCNTIAGTSAGCHGALTTRSAVASDANARELLNGARLETTIERVTRSALATVGLSAQDTDNEGTRIQTLCCSAIAELRAFPAGVIRADVAKFEAMMRLTETERISLGEACRHLYADQLARAEAALKLSFSAESLDLLRLVDTASQPLIRQMGAGAKSALARAMLSAISIK